MLHQSVKINDVKVDSMLDTGLEISLIIEQLVQQLNRKMELFIDPTPYAANSKPLSIFGKFKTANKN